MLMPVLGHVSDSAELDMMLDGEVIIIIIKLKIRPLLTIKMAGSSSILIMAWIYSSSSLRRRSAASSIGRVTSRRPPEPSAGAADAPDRARPEARGSPEAAAMAAIVADADNALWPCAHAPMYSHREPGRFQSTVRAIF